MEIGWSNCDAQPNSSDLSRKGDTRYDSLPPCPLRLLFRAALDNSSCLMAFRIKLEKENFKFSCSHFTILAKEHAERLHGHNYYVTVELAIRDLDPALGLAFDFNAIKPLVRKLADELDEFVLLPANSNYLKIETLSSKQIRATFGAKTYEFPGEDVKLLPVVNVSSEELARYFSTRLSEMIRQNGDLKSCIRTLTVGIQETRGQAVEFETSL